MPQGELLQREERLRMRVPKVHMVELASELALEGRVKLEKNLVGAHILDTAFVDRASRKLNSIRHEKILPY